jgi:hypothetical protein
MAVTMLKEDSSAKNQGSSETVHDSDSTALESGPVKDSKVYLGADSLVVDWDGSDDVANPVNWPASSRWAHIIMISILGLIMYISTFLVAS